MQGQNKLTMAINPPPWTMYNYMGWQNMPNQDMMAWQQQWSEWAMKGWYYPNMIGAGQAPLPPNTPPGDMELRMADHVESEGVNPPLPPESPFRPPLPPGDPEDENDENTKENNKNITNGLPIIYDDAQSTLTVGDTLGFYTRYYAYQDYKHLRPNINRSPNASKGSAAQKKQMFDLNLQHIPLPVPSHDLNNNNQNETVATYTISQNKSLKPLSSMDTLDIPLPESSKEPAKRQEKTAHDLSRRRSKLKKHLKAKYGRKSLSKIMKPKRKRKSSKTSKKSLEPGEIDDSPVCISD